MVTRASPPHCARVMQLAQALKPHLDQDEDRGQYIAEMRKNFKGSFFKIPFFSLFSYFHFNHFKVSISRIISLIAKYSPWKQEKESPDPGQESNRALPRLILLATQWPDRREVKTQIFTHSWPQKTLISKWYLILHACIEQRTVPVSSKCQIGIGKPLGTEIPGMARAWAEKDPEFETLVWCLQSKDHEMRHPSIQGSSN